LLEAFSSRVRCHASSMPLSVRLGLHSREKVISLSVVVKMEMPDAAARPIDVPQQPPACLSIEASCSSGSVSVSRGFLPVSRL